MVGEQDWSSDWFDDTDSNPVVAVSPATLVKEFGIGPYRSQIYVRWIDAQALQFIERYRSVDSPVHLWHPKTLNGVGLIDAHHIIVTQATPLDPSPLYSLKSGVAQLTLNGTTCRRGELLLADLDVQQLAVGYRYLNTVRGFNSHLRKLSIFDYTAADLSSLPTSPSLEELRLFSPRRLTSLEGIQLYPRLTVVEANFAKLLRDVSALRLLSGLEEVVLQGNRGIDSLDFVKQCQSLRYLNIVDCGAIESLSPLRGNASIESVMAYGNTRISDYDLSPLLTMPRLHHLGLANHKSYQTKRGGDKSWPAAARTIIELDYAAVRVNCTKPAGTFHGIDALWNQRSMACSVGDEAFFRYVDRSRVHWE